MLAYTSGEVSKARDQGTTRLQALAINQQRAMPDALSEKMIETIYTYRDVPWPGIEAYSMWACHANANGVELAPMEALHADMARCFAKPFGDPCVRELRNRAMGLPPVPAGQIAPDTPDMLAIKRTFVSSPNMQPAITRQPLAGSCEKPGYPQASLMNKEAGTVTLRLLIDAQGSVIDGQVLKSSGSATLDQAALTALGRCKYAPISKNGQPDSGLFQISYTFAVDGGAR